VESFVRRLEIVDYSYVEFSALELESPVVFRLKTFLRKSRLASHPAQFAGRCHAMVSLGLKDLPGIARSLACIWTPSVSTSTTKESRLIEIAHLFIGHPDSAILGLHFVLLLFKTGRLSSAYRQKCDG
jgi:hypothetical protein